MYSPVQLAFKYIQYFFTASNGKGHGVHSPFVFDFIVHVLNDKKIYYSFNAIEQLRNDVQTNEQVLQIDDFGAGSRTTASKQRSVASIAKSALKPRKFGQLFFRMVDKYQPQNIVELGTSLGITTCYLASANHQANVYTMEGAKAVAGVARQHFGKLRLNNITQIIGNFDETLQPLLGQLKTVDLVYVDGNHREEPTVRYFHQLLPHCNEHTILVFDDVHWSKEMEAAWQTIQDHPAVTCTIDLFFIGIVLLRKDFKAKQHFSIRF